MKEYSRVYARINLDAIAHNMEQMKNHIGEGAQIIAVLKMDGYGHGAGPIAQIFEEKDYVWGYATASFEEAVSLKNAGVKKPVLVLGCIFPEQYEEMLQLGIHATVYMKEMAEAMSEAAVRFGKTAHFHIKIDTGMGRLGFFPDSRGIEDIKDISGLSNVKLEGAYTHFAKADETDKSYTIEQHEKFAWVENALRSEGIDITYYHCNNSAGIIDFPDMKHNLVRAGISIYGMYPFDEVCHEQVNLRPSLELISHITFVKEVEAGTSISYGGTFVTPKKMRVATIPVGYGDGYSRGLSNKADVLIHGKRARILGRVCMDQFMVDVTHIPEARYMDQAVLIGVDGNEHISVEELSNICGRFNYEFVCCLGRRIPRVYVKNGKVIEQVEYLS
ncbi:MAG: alanine racemase [Muricomes sp.]